MHVPARLSRNGPSVDAKLFYVDLELDEREGVNEIGGKDEQEEAHVVLERFQHTPSPRQRHCR
jgi:hypothetical protein